MLILDNQKIKATALKESLDVIRNAMKYDELKTRQLELTELSEQDGFWAKIEESNKVNKELKRLTDRLTKYDKLESRVQDTILLIEMVEEEGADSDVEEVNATLEKLATEVDQMRIENLLSGKYDAMNAILTLHAGAGGTEAQDWVSMLYRMYTRYAEREGYNVKTLDYLAGDEAGIKSVTFLVEGDNAYGYLRAEKGVHRLVRISPFDSNSRRHTSFASLEVAPEIDSDINVTISPDELKVDTYRSSGAGGQHVNKTESAIRITHIPTGIVVSCQIERSQVQNREVAMRMLMGKLVELKERQMQEEADAIKGELKKIEWGSQIRSYVFCPYTMVKDHRTGYETGNIQAVMDGELEPFIIEYLKKA